MARKLRRFLEMLEGFWMFANRQLMRTHQPVSSRHWFRTAFEPLSKLQIQPCRLKTHGHIRWFYLYSGFIPTWPSIGTEIVGDLLGASQQLRFKTRIFAFSSLNGLRKTVVDTSLTNDNGGSKVVRSESLPSAEK